MPFFDEQDKTLDLTMAAPEVEAFEPTQKEKAVNALLNTAGVGGPARALAYRFSEPMAAPDPNFDPFEENNIKGYENYADNFIRVQNQEEMNHIKARIDTEKYYQKVNENAGMDGLAMNLAAGILDPINLAFGGTSAATGLVARMGLKGKVISGALGTAGVGLASSAAYEGVYQATSETRTAEESATTIGFATVLTGVIGGVLGKVSNKEFVKIADSVEQELDAFGKGTVGAAQVVGETIEDTTIKSALGAEKLLVGISPIDRLATSQSLKARQVAMGLAESALERKGAVEGIAQDIAVESVVRQWMGRTSRMYGELDKTFLEYRQATGLMAGTRTAIGDTFGATGGKMTFGQFKEEVGRAMIRGDKHENPFVQKMAEAYRREVFDPLKERAIKTGLLPEGVTTKTAQSYLTRVYDVPKIIAQRPEFVRRISTYLQGTAKNVGQRIAATEAQLKQKVSKTLEDKLQELYIMRGLKPEEWDDIAEDIVDQIVGGNHGGVQYEISPLTRGPMKGRTLLIDDVEIEDFLERDITKVANYYTRTMATDSELADKFGSATLVDQINDVKLEYRDLRKGVTDPKKLKALAKEEKDVIDDIAAIRDRLRGTFGRVNDPNGKMIRGIRVAKNLNYLRLLGGMTLSSFTDVARPVMRNGLLNAYSAGFKPLITNWKAVKMTAEETKLAGAAWDLVDSSTAKTIWDITEQHAATSKFERGVEWMADRFGSVTLMNHWNTGMKIYAGSVIQHTLNKTILNYSKADKKFVARLATLGIGKNNVASIASQLKKFGKDVDGIFVANTEAWTDVDAVRAYRAALSKEINIEIVTPGQEKSLWMSDAHYGFIAQFKSFAVSSVQRTLLTALQDRDMAALNGLLMSIGIGAGIYYLKTPRDKLSDDPKVWASNAIDRSGMTGILFEVNNTVEALTKGGVGMTRLTGEKIGRFTDRQAYESLLGPVPALVVETGGAIGGTVTGDFTQQDLHRVRKLIPMQNLFYIKWLFDNAEKGAAKALDLPAKQSQEKAR